MRTTIPFALAAALAFAPAATGCALPPSVPLRAPEAPTAAPAGVEHKDGSFAGVHGTQLYEQSWRPSQGTPRAVVVIVHGLKDHSANYRVFAERLALQGFAVRAFDLRGHGRSEGMRVWVDSFDDYLGDLDIFMQRVRKEEPSRPVFLFGHSMGGAIATLYTITGRPELAGLALSGAALAVDASGAKIGGVKFVAAIAPTAGVFELDLHQFSRDPAVVSAGLADPLVHQPGAAVQTARELITAIGRIQERMGEIVVPLLAMHGEADVITPPAGSKALVERATSTDKTLKLYPGLFHDLLHEPEKEQVMTDLMKWISDHVAARPAGP
jgi:alpha-beta hydrolase superfamily lysophospholipase